MKIKRTKKFVARVYFSDGTLQGEDIDNIFDSIFSAIMNNVSVGVEATVFTRLQHTGRVTFIRKLSVVGQNVNASQRNFNTGDRIAFEIHAVRRRGFGVPHMRSLVEDSLDEIRTLFEFVSVEYTIEEKAFFAYKPQIDGED